MELQGNTLYQVRGCCFCNMEDSCIQLPDWGEFGRWRFMDSPFRPIWFSEPNLRPEVHKRNWSACAETRTLPCKTTSATTSLFSSGLGLLMLLVLRCLCSMTRNGTPGSGIQKYGIVEWNWGKEDRSAENFNDQQGHRACVSRPTGNPTATLSSEIRFIPARKLTFTAKLNLLLSRVPNAEPASDGQTRRRFINLTWGRISWKKDRAIRLHTGQLPIKEYMQAVTGRLNSKDRAPASDWFGWIDIDSGHMPRSKETNSVRGRAIVKHYSTVFRYEEIGSLTWCYTRDSQ